MDRLEVQERIRQRAYELWEGEGRPQGRDVANWLRAEADVIEEIAKANAGVPKPRARKSASRKTSVNRAKRG